MAFNKIAHALYVVHTMGWVYFSIAIYESPDRKKHSYMRIYVVVTN